MTEELKIQKDWGVFLQKLPFIGKVVLG